MAKIIMAIGPSGIGKTALVKALEKTGHFSVTYKQHEERPFQALLKQDTRYGLANQIDYLLLRAEQERTLRAAPQIGLIDGGLDLDYHGFTRLFHSRGLLTDPEFDLCRKLYKTLRVDALTGTDRLAESGSGNGGRPIVRARPDKHRIRRRLRDFRVLFG